MYISILHVSLKRRSFRYCAKNGFVPPQSYYVYSDIERIDFNFDIVTNVQVVGCELPPPPNTHPLMLLVRLPSRNLQKTLQDIKASERKERQVLVEDI